VSFSDSDWTAEAGASAAARRDSTWVWTLVLGLVVGAAGATLVFLMLERFAQRDAPQSVTATAALAPAAAPAPAAVIDSAPPAAGPSAPPASSAAASVTEPIPGLAPAATVAPRPSADEMRRRERAWAAFYKRPASCDGNPTTDQLIECANHFIRSKREFDERWKAGNL
jgi:hypothetical protein